MWLSDYNVIQKKNNLLKTGQINKIHSQWKRKARQKRIYENLTVTTTDINYTYVGIEYFPTLP